MKENREYVEINLATHDSLDELSKKYPKNVVIKKEDRLVVEVFLKELKGVNKIIELFHNEQLNPKDIFFNENVKLIIDNCYFDFNHITFHGSKYEINKCEFINKEIRFVLVNTHSLILKNITFKNEFYLSLNSDVKEIKIYNCEFKNNFTIKGGDNNHNISDIYISFSTFAKVFSLSKLNIDEFSIYENIFESISMISGINFNKKFLILTSTHKNSMIIENCNFKIKPQFKLSVYEKNLFVMNSTFFKSLDLDASVFEKEISFVDIKGLDSKDSRENTSRETYRIIKYNLEKIGNKIEANKYHALELDKRRQELESDFKKDPSSSWKDYLVFKVHSLSSEHSSNWLRVLLWIFIVGFITAFIKTVFLKNDVSVEYEVAKAVFEGVVLKHQVVFYPDVDLYKINMILTSLSIFLIVWIVYKILPEVITLLKEKIKNKNIKSFLNKIDAKSIDTILITTLICFIFLLVFQAISFDDVFKYISITTKMEDFGSPALAFFNKALLAYLYYQFVTSIRKDTRK